MRAIRWFVDVCGLLVWGARQPDHLLPRLRAR